MLQHTFCISILSNLSGILSWFLLSLSFKPLFRHTRCDVFVFQCVKEAILEDLQKIGKEGGLKSFEQVGTADTILVPQVPLEFYVKLPLTLASNL